MSVEHHRRAVQKIELKPLLDEGAESRVFDDSSGFVDKISLGKVQDALPSGDFVEIDFDLEHVPDSVRKLFLQRYLVIKILRVLYPQIFPQMTIPITKAYPRFKQKKVSGVKEYDDVELAYARTEVAGVYDQHERRFKVHTKIHKVPTKKGADTAQAWRTAVVSAREKLLPLGVHIDAAQHHDNFIKDEQGIYWYIDTIGIPNPKATADALEKSLYERFSDSERMSKQYVSLASSLRKFKKISGIGSAQNRSTT
ncbi:MAG: hypothetical protein WAX38_03285 [Minisyncoccia bacterium]